MGTKTRIAVAVVTISFAAGVALLHEEGYSDVAYDDGVGVPTLGFGSTTHSDGSPVRYGERTNVMKALDRSLKDVVAVESELRKCIKVPVSQNEWDFAVHFSYNIGQKAFCESSIVRFWNMGQYEAGCSMVKAYYYAQGKDCRVRENNCYGLIGRREREYSVCVGAGL